jgi:hypothetical protein
MHKVCTRPCGGDADSDRACGDPILEMNRLVFELIRARTVLELGQLPIGNAKVPGLLAEIVELLPTGIVRRYIRRADDRSVSRRGTAIEADGVCDRRDERWGHSCLLGRCVYSGMLHPSFARVNRSVDAKEISDTIPDSHPPRRIHLRKRVSHLLDEFLPIFRRAIIPFFAGSPDRCLIHMEHPSIVPNKRWTALLDIEIRDGTHCGHKRTIQAAYRIKPTEDNEPTACDRNQRLPLLVFRQIHDDLLKRIHNRLL